MSERKSLKQIITSLSMFSLMIVCCAAAETNASAISFPPINVNFEPSDESVVVDSVPASSPDGSIEYQLDGYLNYGSERVETFCFAPNVMPYDIPPNQGYIFNWSGEAEFLLPCSGNYQFTAYLTARFRLADGRVVEEIGPKTTISFTLHKADESTNWGPGLPNTTVESYDLAQIKGTDQTISIEESDYIWTIHGQDIETVPQKNISLNITANPDSFDNTGVDTFFGDTVALKMNIEHSGEFGFKALLAYNLGAEYAGKYANLFYVAGDGDFEYIDGSLVDETGVAVFAMTHASDYVMAVTEEAYTGQPLYTSVEESVVDSPAQKPEAAVPEEVLDAPVSGVTDTGTGGTPNGSGLLLVGSSIVLIAAAAVWFVLARKKKC